MIAFYECSWCGHIALVHYDQDIEKARWAVLPMVMLCQQAGCEIQYGSYRAPGVASKIGEREETPLD